MKFKVGYILTLKAMYVPSHHFYKVEIVEIDKRKGYKFVPSPELGYMARWISDDHMEQLYEIDPSYKKKMIFDKELAKVLKNKSDK